MLSHSQSATKAQSPPKELMAQWEGKPAPRPGIRAAQSPFYHIADPKAHTMSPFPLLIPCPTPWPIPDPPCILLHCPPQIQSASHPSFCHSSSAHANFAIKEVERYTVLAFPLVSPNQNMAGFSHLPQYTVVKGNLSFRLLTATSSPKATPWLLCEVLA